MTPGTRIRVTGGPWPERIGCLGQIAQPPAGWGDRYPVAGLGSREVIVALDDDPLYERLAGTEHEWWSHVIDRREVEVVA